MLNRRKLIKNSIVGSSAIVAAPVLSSPALSQNRTKLTMVTTWGRGSAGVFDSALRIADHVKTMSGGTLEIEVKGAGELVGAFEVFDAVTSGTAEMYHGADYYFIGQHPGYAFLTGIPFGMTATEHNNWWYHMGGREFGDELGEMFNLKPFAAGNSATQPGGWFRKPVNSPEDFIGLKFRMPGLGGKALGLMGASVQNIPGPEVYQALATGAIDATEWIGPWSDEGMGFHEITKIYYTAGFHEPGAMLSCAVNREVFNSLSSQHQKIIELACAESNIWGLSLYLANNGTALQRLVNEGVIVSQFSDSIWDAFGNASRQVIEDNLEDPLFKRMYESYSDSLKKSSDWISQSISVYQAQRNQVFGW